MALPKYKDSNGNVKTLSNVTVNLLDGLEGKVLVSIENATISSNDDSSINGKTRAYSIIEKDGVEEIIYSDVITMQL